MAKNRSNFNGKGGRRRGVPAGPADCAARKPLQRNKKKSHVTFYKKCYMGKSYPYCVVTCDYTALYMIRKGILSNHRRLSGFD
jgi:hypothetical protein